MAEREAANIIAELDITLPIQSLELLNTIMAAAWLRGHRDGALDTAREALGAFEQLETDLRRGVHG